MAATAKELQKAFKDQVAGDKDKQKVSRCTAFLLSIFVSYFPSNPQGNADLNLPTQWVAGRPLRDRLFFLLRGRPVGDEPLRRRLEANRRQL